MAHSGAFTDMAILAHKIRLNPTPEQEDYFNQAAGVKRFVYNWGLEVWKKSHSESGTVFGVMAIKKQFNSIKEEQYPWVKNVAKDVAEGAFQDLGTALKNHFDYKKGKRKSWIGFPRFKSRRRSKQSFRLNNQNISVEENKVRIPRLGWVNMTESLRMSGKIMGAVVSKTADWWFISISVDTDLTLVDIPKSSVGVDLGVKTLAKLSDGSEFENQGLLRKVLRKLKRLNRELARRIKGSNRWYRTKRQLARLHYKIACKRKDFINKMTTKIASTYKLIGIEDLNVEGMVRNRRLALSISDASFGEILKQLVYKSVLFGSQVIKVDRFFASSKICSDCGFKNQELTLSDRTWTCPACNKVHDRDLNASINLESEALRLVTS